MLTDQERILEMWTEVYKQFMLPWMSNWMFPWHWFWWNIMRQKREGRPNA